MGRQDSLYLRNAKKVEFKEDGTFIAHAPITSIGVYVYRRENGTTNELRSYEEVFKTDSLNTLENLPITLHHPNDKITKENQEQYEVGRVIGNISHYDNDPRVYADLHITNKAAVKAALADGVKFLSCGYESRDLKTDGVFLGMKYDTMQTNIVYNHLALCRKPRGDENLMIKLDGIAEALKFDEAQTEFVSTTNGENSMEQKQDTSNSNADTIKMFADMQIKLDGKEKELITAKAETEKVKGEKDALQAKCDSLASELKSLQDSFPSQIHDLAYKLSTLRTLVNEWGVEGVKADATEQEMKVAIISKHDKNFKADGKSEDYINARFDSTIELATAEKKKNAECFQLMDKKGLVFEDKFDMENLVIGCSFGEEKKFADKKDKWNLGVIHRLVAPKNTFPADVKIDDPEAIFAEFPNMKNLIVGDYHHAFIAKNGTGKNQRKLLVPGCIGRQAIDMEDYVCKIWVCELNNYGLKVHRLKIQRI